MQQQMFQPMEPPQAPAPMQAAGPAQVNPNAGQPPQQPNREQNQGMRGGSMPQSQFQRGRGGSPQVQRGASRPFAGRGRGTPTAPARAASPLPPNVPTGPRNANKYKDRDNNAPAVDGLDYGGGERSSRTPTDVHEDRTARSVIASLLLGSLLTRIYGVFQEEKRTVA